MLKIYGFLISAVLFLISCSINSGINKDNNNSTPLGNPSNYNVYILTGQSLGDKTTAINGLSVDTSSVDSISASVQSILISTNKLKVVTEISGTYWDYTADFTATAKQVPDLFYGAGLQWGSKYFLTMPKYLELVKHLRINIIRFPAGQERFRYNRLAVTTSTDSLGNYQPYQYILTGEDISNFISLCRNFNIQAEPEVNIYNDDVTMWSNMADQVVNELGYDLKYISSGNEPEYNAFSNWIYLNATNQYQGISNYMDRFLRYSAAISVVKPGITFSLGELGSDALSDLSQYIDWMISGRNITVPVVLSAHWYMLGDYGQPFSYSDYPSISNLIIGNGNPNQITFLSNYYSVLRQKSDQYLNGAGIFLGEWATSWSASAGGEQVQDTVATAIFVAEVMEYAKKLGFNSMEYFGSQTRYLIPPGAPQ